MTLKEIQKAIASRIDAAWNDVKDEVDADKVRAYVQGLTAELYEHVLAVEAHLVNHVLGKQETGSESEPATAPGDGGAEQNPESAQ